MNENTIKVIKIVKNVLEWVCGFATIGTGAAGLALKFMKGEDKDE